MEPTDRAEVVFTGDTRFPPDKEWFLFSKKMAANRFFFLSCYSHVEVVVVVVIVGMGETIVATPVQLYNLLLFNIILLF